MIYDILTLAAIGISSTGLSIVASWGICSAVGLSYGPMHSLIPCLLVGLGIDDMFILVQSWDNLVRVIIYVLASITNACRVTYRGWTYQKRLDELCDMPGLGLL